MIDEVRLANGTVLTGQDALKARRTFDELISALERIAAHPAADRNILKRAEAAIEPFALPHDPEEAGRDADPT